MLDDKTTMDDTNPFVDFMPGSSRQPHAFGEYTGPVDEPEESYKSPACDVVTRNVGRPGYREEECSLSRPLLPGRNIDKGFTVPEKVIDMEKVTKAVKSGVNNNFIMNLISILCLILLIVMF